MGRNGNNVAKKSTGDETGSLATAVSRLCGQILFKCGPKLTVRLFLFEYVFDLNIVNRFWGITQNIVVELLWCVMV